MRVPPEDVPFFALDVAFSALFFLSIIFGVLRWRHIPHARGYFFSAAIFELVACVARFPILTIQPRFKRSVALPLILISGCLITCGLCSAFRSIQLRLSKLQDQKFHRKSLIIPSALSIIAIAVGSPILQLASRGSQRIPALIFTLLGLAGNLVVLLCLVYYAFCLGIQARKPDTSIHEATKCHLEFPRPYHRLLLVVFIGSILGLVRVACHIVNCASAGTGTRGYLERYLRLFDGIPMLLTMVTILLLHPRAEQLLEDNWVEPVFLVPQSTLPEREV